MQSAPQSSIFTLIHNIFNAIFSPGVNLCSKESKSCNYLLAIFFTSPITTGQLHSSLYPSIFLIILNTSPTGVELLTEPQNFLQYDLFACLIVILTTA